MKVINSEIGCIVLAAGESSRLGHPKALIEVGGETLVSWVSRRLTELGLSPVIVTRNEDPLSFKIHICQGFSKLFNVRFLLRPTTQISLFWKMRNEPRIILSKFGGDSIHLFVHLLSNVFRTIGRVWCDKLARLAERESFTLHISRHVSRVKSYMKHLFRWTKRRVKHSCGKIA